MSHFPETGATVQKFLIVGFILGILFGVGLVLVMEAWL